MKKVAFLFMLCSINLVAQKYELGKVTVQELEEKVCPSDSSTVAAILFTVGEISFDYQDDKGFYFTRKVRSKIKVYKKEGYSWANKSIIYYTGAGSKESVRIDDAITYNLVNGKIEKSKLKSDGEFDEKLNIYRTSKKITMPNVKEGSIIEFEYTLKSDYIGSIDEWYFQSTIPVLYSEFNVNIPEYFTYKPTFRGFITPKVKISTKSRTISFTYKENKVGGLNTGLPKTTTSNMQFVDARTTYYLENVVPIKEESYVNNIKNYIASVEHELLSVKYPNSMTKNYATDWETVSKKIYANEDFGAELNKTDYFEKDLKAMIEGKITQEEKLVAIFSYVKSKMNWNGIYGYSCNNGVKKAFQENTGNVAEINLMLTSMLRFAGINANPVLLSTRGNGISLFPSRNAFDYVISGVELNNNLLLLDATNKYALPNILPIRDLNWFGRLIRKDETSTQIDLMPTFNSKEMINVMAEINANGEISGKARDQYLDYNAFVYRGNYNGLNNDSRIEKIEKQYPGLEISELEVLNGTDLSKPIVEDYSFDSTNHVEIIGDKMYFSPLLHFTLKENPFKQETRLYPIDFVFPHQDKYIISIKIPDGYAVETLPASKAIGMTDSKAVYKYTISNTGNQIQLMYTFDVNTAIIGSDEYEEVKAFYKDMVEKNTEKVVLKKI